MQLSSVIKHVQSSNLCQQLLERTSRIDRLNIFGTSRLANALIISSLSQSNNSPLLLIVPTFEEASRWYPILELIGWQCNYIYPTGESSPFDSIDDSNEIKWGQLQVISELIKESNNQKICIITTERALQPHLPPPEYLIDKCINLNVGIEIDIDQLSNQLSNIGYTKVNTVEQEGSWARRGDIIDIFPVNNELPIRLELFGDNLEKIREFDPTSQLSQELLNKVFVTPIGINPLIYELLSDIEKDSLMNHINNIHTNPNSKDISNFAGLKRLIFKTWDQPSSLIEYLPSNTFVVIEDQLQCIAHGENWLSTLNLDNPSQSFLDELCIGSDFKLTPIQECFQKLISFKGLNINSIDSNTHSNYHNVSDKKITIQPNQFGTLSVDIKDYLKSKYAIFLLSAQPSRTVALLEEHDCPAKFVVNTSDYKLISDLIKDNTPIAIKCSSEAQLEGIHLPNLKLIIFTDKEFYGQQNLLNSTYIRRRKKAFSNQIDTQKLHPGDFVVHRNHGIGEFKKIENITINFESRDYLVIHYLDGILRVAADQLGSINRYRSSSDSPPKINKLGGNAWLNTKERARKGIKKIAIDLIKLYAERDSLEGYSFPPDGPWQSELEDSFPYEPTKDQLSAVVDVKKDMEQEKPMDRLVCGDVGFGKTEVALRAIFKAITSGKQVALLAPTTILAQQHWRTISERFAPYPIKVSLLNRFRTSAEKKIILSELEDGKIDAIVGTHLLLNKNTKFSNLGLLVIDEEQRFGVNQKEKIKSLKKTVDVLTLSATPIPRTLYMSLSGVREMSLITTPPPLRRSIKTNLFKFDNDVIRSAILQEIDRGGQVFYVVPRVDGITKVAERLSKMIPTLNIIIAHGQMSEGELESAMIAFNSGESDLMLCTTIIESGLDIPRVNTIIIEDSHKFGLAQLYQLRGRVGRSGIQAYAWLLYPETIKLTDASRQRLKAIQEFSSLGSGYQLSMRDMEIRGVGNLLGIEQSGQMEVIGFDLYMELLKEAMSDIKGQEIPKVEETQIDLPITAFIPGDYIVESDQKLSAYRTASDCNTQEELIQIATNWIDRFGPLPKPVETLLEIMKLKILAKKCGFSRIKLEKPNIILETLIDEPGFRLLREGLPKHLHGRLIYKNEDKTSKVIARGLGILPNEKQIDQLCEWLKMMESQINEN